MMKMGHISALLLGLLPLCTLIVGTSIKNNNGMYEVIIGGNRGSCPPQRIYSRAENEICHDLCSGGNCPNGQICCKDNCHRMCKPPPQVRPGTCPTYEAPSSSKPCDSYCSTDSECRANWKCCKKGCGHTCTPTLEAIGKPSTEPKPREGFCPQEEMYTCLRAERHYCNADSCMDGLKCCPNICRMECQVPLQERVGECPPSAQCPAAADSKTCSSDHDCPTLHKCCSTCGNRCAKAGKIPSSLHNGTSVVFFDGRK